MKVKIKTTTPLLLSQLIEITKGFKKYDTAVSVEDGEIVLEEFPF